MPTLNLTKLVTNQDTFGEMVEKINTNFDIISQAQGLRGEEGKRGTAGVPGPPGSIGPQGLQGAQGTNGNRWYFGEDFTDFNTSATNIGDFFLEGLTGDVRERKTTGWEVTGTVVSSSGGDSNILNSFIPTVNNKTKIIKPIKTNYTLEITDISGDNPNYQVSPFSNNADTANFVIGQTTAEQNWLQEMGLKIYTSEGDPVSSLYGLGKQIHLANSTALIENKSIGWANQSGFTLTVDWDDSETDLEVFRIKNIKSTDSNHTQRIEIESDRVSLIGDYIFANAPLKLYNIDKDSLSPGDIEYGTIIYDNDSKKVFAYAEGTPDLWIELGGGTSSGNTGFTHGKIFDNAGTEIPTSIQTAGSPDTILRLKAGNGINIVPIDVEDPLGDPLLKRSWEIKLSSLGSPGVDDFGTILIQHSGGGLPESISSDAPGDTFIIEEGDNITIENTSDLLNKRIKINSTASGNGGTPSFKGMKYVFGQLGKGAFNGANQNGQPLGNPFIEFPNIITNNNGSLVDMRNLSFPTIVPYFDNPPNPFKVDSLANGTIFTSTLTGYWQINAFAFGLIEMPDYNGNTPPYYSYTVAGAIRKTDLSKTGQYDYSHISIAESYVVNPSPFFNNNIGGGIGGNISSYPWPTWTINCSDIIYLDSSSPADSFTISVGALYAPDPNNNPSGLITPGVPGFVNLYYCSGYVSAVYLGD